LDSFELSPHPLDEKKEQYGSFFFFQTAFYEDLMRNIIKFQEKKRLKNVMFNVVNSIFIYTTYSRK